MGRKISTDLHSLIRAMKGPEKRYFQVFSKRHVLKGKNNYVSLFRAIEKQESYDEQKLLRENPWLKPAFFADQKNNLYWLVLRSLSVYSSGSTADSRLKFLLNSFDILFSKGLFSQGRKVIAKAKKEAWRLERNALFLECLEREKKLEFAAFNLKSSPPAIHRINTETGKALRRIQTDLDYNTLSERMFFILVQETFIRSEKNKKLSRAIVRDPLMRKAPKGISILSLFNYHRTHSLYCYSHSDHKGFYKHCKAIVSLIEEHDYLFADSPKTYIVALQNLLIALKNLERYQELFVELRRLKQYESDSAEMMAQVFAIATDIELTLYIDTGQFEKGTLMGPAINKGIEEYRQFITTRHEMLFFFNLGYCFTGAGQPHIALRWMNKVYDHPEGPQAMPLVHDLSRIVALLLHYELEHFDLLDYRIRTVARTFGRKNALYEVESTLLDFLSRAIVTPRDKDLKLLKQELYDKIKKLHDDPRTRSGFATFDFLCWAESQLTGKTMAELRRKKPK